MRRALPLALVALVLAGCSSDVPAEEDFAAGTCRTAAPDVRAVGELLPDVGDGPKVDADVKDELADAQDRLVALADGAEPDLKAVLTRLVEAIGIVRIRADGNSFEKPQREALTRAYEGVVDACVSR